MIENPRIQEVVGSMPKPRVFVIGLDGATLDLILPWAAAGHLPHLARFLAEGSYAELMSTIPPVSPATWTSFMTGKNPGQHGVFDFTVRDFRDYGVRVTLRSSEPTLWGILSAHGRQVCVVNVPQSYPPEPVNGYLVTGLGTPSHRVFTYPEDLTLILRREGYPITTKASLQRDGSAAFIADVYRTAEQIADIAIRLMHQLDWDFSMVVLRLTDEIPHYFWHWMDKTHPAHCHAEAFLRNAVLDCYCKADELVGKLMETVDDETIVIVMSDHGFGPLYKDVYLNEWLRQQGFLRLRSRLTLRAVITRLLQRLGVTHTQIGHALSRLGLHWLRGTLRDRLGSWAELFPQDAQPRVAELVDWSRTRAYSVGYIGQIYVNLIGRDPQGIVAPGEEYEQVREELITQLQKLVDPEDEQPVVDQVYKKEEIYSGRFMLEAPDLLVLMRGLSYITRQGYELSKHRLIFAQPPTHETGGHRMQGILLARGPHIKHGAMIRPRIVDLAPTILHILGCPVPQDIDGLVLRELLRSDFLENHPIVYTNDVQPRSIMVSELTKEEERELLSRLRAFGYIDDRSLTSK